MFRIHFVITVFLTVTVVGCGFSLGVEPNVSALLSEAISLEDNSKPVEAKQIYEQIISNSSSQTEIQRAKVRAARIDTIKLIKAKNFENASTKIVQIVADYNDCQDIPWFLYSAASSYHEIGMKAEAIRLYDITIKRANTSVKLRNSSIIKRSQLCALSLLDEGRFDEADAEILETVNNYAEHNNLKWYLFSIASRYDELKQKSRATAYYKLCIQKFGDDVYGVKSKVKLARIDALQAIASGLRKKACSELESVLECYHSGKVISDVKWYLYHIGCALDEKGYSEDADKFYKKFLELFSDDELSKEVNIRLKLLNAKNEDEISLVLNEIESLTVNGGEGLGQYEWCIYSCACRLSERKYGEQAIALFSRFIEAFPESKFVEAAKIKIARIKFVDYLADCNSLEESCAKLGQFRQDYNDNPEFGDTMFGITEAYLDKALKSDANVVQKQLYLEQAVLILKNDVLPKVETEIVRAEADYLLGLSYWHSGRYFEAAESFELSIKSNPRHEFAGHIHWLISDCYEKLKKAGEMPAADADTAIEWGYQTLFDNYPDCSIIDYAAMRLSQINLEKGNQTAACAYYCWLMMNAEGDANFINNMYKHCGRCGK